MVVWRGDGDFSDVFAARFDANGVLVGAPWRVNLDTATDQTNPRVHVLPDGRFAVVWMSWGTVGGEYEVMLQKYAVDGTPLGALPW